MAIGSPTDLFNAAQGRIAPRTFVPPAPVDNSAFEAEQRRAALAKSASDVFAGGGQVSTQATPTYSNIVGGATRATGGLSAKGKYGGFSNAGDLQTAIEGATISLGRTATPSALRAKAQAFYNKIDPMYGEASKSPSRAFIGQGTAQMPGVDPNRQYSAGSYVGKIVNPSRQYAQKLNEWYTKQSAPAEEYMQTAQQLEATPLSALATQIATSAYGMNPDLAAGKFAGLDTSYYTQQRDAQSMAQYGVPYAQRQDQLAAAAKEQKAIPGQWASAIENTTGFKATALSSILGQTPEQIYSTYGQNYEFTDPATKTVKTANGQAIIEEMKKYMATGDEESALELSESLGQQDLARVLNAMYAIGRTKDIKTRQLNTLYSTR